LRRPGHLSRGSAADIALVPAPLVLRAGLGAMAAGNQVVEVRKSTESSTWYNASVLDVTDDHVRVSFEGNIWPVKEVPIGLVRFRPDEACSADFDPQEGEAVEVRLGATEANPSGWTAGRVKAIKNRTFYFVAIEGTQRTTQDQIVERDSLRRLSANQALDPRALERRLVAVDRGLHQWIRSEDSHGCLSNVAIKSGLLAASTSDVKNQPKVLLIGEAQAVDLGERLLVDVHFKYQLKMQTFHEYREYFLQNIKYYEQWNGGKHKETFTIGQSFLGRVIGKKGDNIQRIRQTHSVEVKIQDAENNWDDAYITVIGESAEEVRLAREQMEYVVVFVEVEPEQVGWVVGKGHQNLLDIQHKAELVYARFDDRSSSVELCGLRSQVEDATLLLSVHQEYLPVYDDMSQQRATMDQQFAELDRKGKGGKKGKGGGKREGKARGRDHSDEEDEKPPMRAPGRGAGKGGRSGEKGGKGGGGGGAGKGGGGKGEKGRGK